MCYQMIPIATVDDHHFIGQCEHGTLHLNWGRLVLSLHPDELLLIARTLRRYHPDSRSDLTSPGVSVLWNDTHAQAALAQVWLAGVGLTLDPAAITFLLQLIAEASERIIRESSALLEQHDLVRMAGYRRGETPN